VRKIVILAMVLALPWANLADAAHACAGGEAAAHATPVAAVDHTALQQQVPPDQHAPAPLSGHAGHCDLCGHGLGLSLIPAPLFAQVLMPRGRDPVIRDLSLAAAPVVDRIDEPPRP
jgi:hypothetical protein